MLASIVQRCLFLAIVNALSASRTLVFVMFVLGVTVVASIITFPVRVASPTSRVCMIGRTAAQGTNEGAHFYLKQGD